jgi:hypothetical protein
MQSLSIQLINVLANKQTIQYLMLGKRILLFPSSQKHAS